MTADDVVRLLGSLPRLLALGEPTHGEEDLLVPRNELFRQLVEEHGYRTIALETDCLAGLLVDDYVTGGDGDLDDVMKRGLSHEWGAFDGNRELVRWMRAHNAGRPAAEHVRFAGFDGPLEIHAAASPRRALTELYAYLAAHADPDLLPADESALLGDDDRWTDPAAMMDPARSVGGTPEAVRLRVWADDLVAVLEAQRPQLTSVRADLLGRTAVGLLRYHAAMADPRPGRFARLLAVRDAMMAANLLALSEQGPTLVHAHNGHLQRDRSSMRMGAEHPHWWSAGAIVSNRLGEDYKFVATAVGTIRHRGVDVPEPDTLEGRLYADRHDQLNGQLTARVSPWFGYAPLDPEHLPNIDGLIFVKDLMSRT